jgi:hypothetical protein
MNKKKPGRRELARRRNIRKWWAKPKHRAARSAESKKRWKNPGYALKVSEGLKNAKAPKEVRDRMSSAAKKALKPKAVRKRIGAGVKKSWTSERREDQRERMLKLRADPEVSARRKAGIDEKWKDSEYRDRMAAAKKKSEARPKLLARRRAQVKKMNTDPAIRARRTSTLKNMWDEFRAARLAQAQQASKPRNRGGRPRKDELWRIAAALNEQGASPREIAREWDPYFAENPDAAEDRMRKGIKRWKLRFHKPGSGR